MDPTSDRGAAPPGTSSPTPATDAGAPATVQISFYGHLTSLAGGRTRSVELTGSHPTVADLRAAVREQIPEVAAHLEGVAVAVDAELVGDDTPLDATRDQEIALLPPVSGG